MALDRDQVGLLFRVNADTADAQQAFQLLRGVVEGMAAETSDQLARMGSRFAAVGDQVRKTGQQFRESFGDAARGQLAGYVGQFGLLGDAAAGMIPSLTGSAAAMVGFAGATVAAGAAMVGAAFSAMDYTGKIDDLAQVTGLTTESIQSLRLAATLSGQSFEEVSNSAIIFQKRIEDAKNGNVELRDTFKQLDVDLNGSVDQAFRQTLERLGQVEAGSAKTATTLDLFGKSGAKLLPVMTQVGGSFDGLTARARELGIVLDEEAIAKSNELADKWDVLKLRLSSLTVGVGLGAIDFFNTLAGSIDLTGRAVRALINDTAKLKLLPDILKEAATGFAEAGIAGASTRVTMLLGQLKLLSEGEPAAGFQGPGIDPATGLPTRTLQKRQPTVQGKAATEKLVNLPSGDAVKRIYDSYVASILTEERRVEAERERLRVAALDGEEARLVDQATRLEQQITQARLQALQMGNDLIQGRMITGRLEVLNAEYAATQGRLSELQTQRDAALEASYAKEVDEYRKKEELKRAEEERTYQNSLRLNQALQAMFEEGRRQRMEALAADPSSPLSLMGPEGQKAADQGKGVFEQLGASANAALGDVSKQMGNFKSMMTDVFSGIASGLESMIAGFILTGKIGGQAFKAMTAQILASLTAQAAVKAIFNVAEGFANLAMHQYDAAAKNFTAAKFYGVVAGVAAAASVGMAAIGGGGGAQGGTMFLGQDRQSGSAVMEQGARRGGTEPTVIIIRAETEPGVMVSKFVQDYRANGEARSVLRRDLLGEF